MSIADTLALLPLVKRQVFCVGDRLKMDKHKAWATTIVAPKSVGSSTTKGQMKPTFRVSLTASQAGENSQINAPEHTNVSSILAYLTFRRNQGRRTAQSRPTIESAKQQTSSNELQNSNLTQYHHKLPTKNINLRFLGLKTKQLSQSIKSIHKKFHVEKLTNQTSLNLNVEAHYQEPNSLQTEKIMNQTISSHSKSSMKIRS